MSRIATGYPAGDAIQKLRKRDCLIMASGFAARASRPILVFLGAPF